MNEGVNDGGAAGVEIRAVVITVSDGCARGVREDLSGEALAALLAEAAAGRRTLPLLMAVGVLFVAGLVLLADLADHPEIQVIR